VNCKIPAKISAGLTFDTALRFDNYPAPDWALSLLLRGPSTIDLVSSQEGNLHRLHVTAGATSTWKPGQYIYSLRAKRGEEVVELSAGSLEVLPDLYSLPVGADVRTPAQIALEAIEAVISKRATIDQERYRIGNRELYRTPIAELIKLRDMYRSEVQREKQAACGANPWGRRILTSFR
jgi:hypothetical protein